MTTYHRIHVAPAHVELDIYETDGTTETNDIGEYAAMLLRAGLEAEESSAGVNTSVNSVELGELHCADDVGFLVDGEEMAHERALALIGDGIVLALRAAIARYEATGLFGAAGTKDQ